MDLSPTTRTTQFSDTKKWLASKHGTDCQDTVTLAIDAFDAQGLVLSKNIDGRSVLYIEAGTPIVKATTGTYSGFYVPAYTGTVVGGADDTWAQATAEGHLYEDVVVSALTGKAGGSLFWHGEVITGNVPKPGAVKFDTAAPAFDATKGSKFIRYV